MNIDKKRIMTNINVYQKLIDHTKDWIFGLPDSEFLLPMLELRFTPEEAALLSKVPFLPHTAEQLSERLEIDINELVKKLDGLAKKGIIYRLEGRSGTVRYSFRDSIFLFYRMPGWKGEDDEWNRKLAPLSNKYYIEVLAADFIGHKTQGLRAIPVNETIKDSRVIMPYEDILKVIDKTKYCAVSTCACRHRHNLDPDFEECKHETSVCLHFDGLGKYTVENGLGKQISKDETLEILKNAADAGLVHGVSNTMEGIDTICNCCSCCCLYLEAIVKMPGMIPRGHQPSNYIREINEEKCIQCGLCVKRCSMKALKLEDKKVIFEPERCIGCGVCVHKCPEEAIYLVHRDEDQIIPKSQRDQGILLLKERGLDPMDVFKKNFIK